MQAIPVLFSSETVTSTVSPALPVASETTIVGSVPAKAVVIMVDASIAIATIVDKILFVFIKKLLSQFDIC